MSRKKTTDPRQLDLFGGALPADDPVATYYRRLRRAGVWLALDPETGEVQPSSDTARVPGWAHREALIHQDRIKADVLRVERGIVPSLARETLEGWRRADPATGLFRNSIRQCGRRGVGLAGMAQVQRKGSN